MDQFNQEAQVIPKGYQILADRLEPAGLKFNKDAAASFASSNNLWLKLEPEPNNKHDKNAIRVISGCSKGWFGTNRRFIGYVPKEISKKIIEGGIWEQIKPRLTDAYVGNSGYVSIMFQILGPKELEHLFKSS